MDKYIARRSYVRFGWIVLSTVFVIVDMVIVLPVLAEEAVVSTTPVYQVEVTALERELCQQQFLTFGQVYPHQKSYLNPVVGGLLVSLTSKFEVGQRVNKGDILAAIDKTDFQYELARARRLLADAELLLAEQQALSERAIAEWRVGNAGSPPDLAARKPQVRAAAAQVEEARHAVSLAERDLAATDIRAPFDGWIVARNASVGNMVSAQSSLAELIPANKMIARVMLTPAQVAMIRAGGSSDRVLVELLTDDNQEQVFFQFHGIEINAIADNESRQVAAQAIIFPAMHEQAKVYPGAFFKARVSTGIQGNYFSVPMEAFNAQGNLFVVENREVRELAVEPRFNSINKRVVDIPGVDKVHLVMSRLDRVWSGMPVNEKVMNYE